MADDDGHLERDMSKLSPLTSDHCIYRVPQQLRVKNPAAYTPKVTNLFILTTLIFEIMLNVVQLEFLMGIHC